MSRSGRRAALVAIAGAAIALAGCGIGDAPTVTASGDHDGLALEARAHRDADSLIVETEIRNTRSDAVHLDADQCGRATRVSLVRTVFEPEGATQAGSLDAVKQLVLRQQRSDQFSDHFAPRPVSGGSDPPACVRPTVPIMVGPGGSIAERWELPFSLACALAEVGSDHATIRVQAVESVAADRLGFLDILPDPDAQAASAGRSVTVDTPASSILDRPPTRPNTDLSLGQRFDRMIGTEAIRSFIESQPAASWRRATITPTAAGPWEFRAVTNRFERALRVDLEADGTVRGEPDVPGPADLTRAFERRPATLPPGIALIPEPDTPVLTEDVIAGRLTLPTGRVVADGALAGGTPPFAEVAEPGDHEVSVTIGRESASSVDTVALATLVVSDAPTVSWVERGLVGVDDGTAGFTSAEGSEALGRAIAGDTASWQAAAEDAFDSLTAHESLITEVSIGDGLDFALFTTGYGDGGYPAYVGLDADGKPTRFVIDFGIVHLAWPDP